MIARLAVEEAASCTWVPAAEKIYGIAEPKIKTDLKSEGGPTPETGIHRPDVSAVN